MKKFVLSGFALAAMVATPAMAADLPVKAAPVPVVALYDWSGIYAGFNIGGAWADVTRTYPQPLAPLGPNTAFTSSGSDWIYGFHVGAQMQWGRLVLGVEAAWSACFDSCRSQVALPSPPFTGAAPATLSAVNKIQDLATIGPRLGYAWDRWMIYGTGGWASANIKGEYINNTTGAGFAPTFWGQSRNHGWFAGVGVEFVVARGVLADFILGAEYQHFDVRSKRAFTDGVVAGSPNTFDHDASGDIVRVRLTVKSHGLPFLAAR